MIIYLKGRKKSNLLRIMTETASLIYKKKRKKVMPLFNFTYKRFTPPLKITTSPDLP